MTLAVAVLFWHVLLGLAAFGLFSSSIFLLLVLIATVRFKKRADSARRSVLNTSINPPPVTILKPVHGMEERLEQNLESFFRQDYPDFEIIIGARSADDPAVALTEKLRVRYPQVKSRIVISGPPAWPNAKVFTLNKMIPLSRNDFFVIIDSDVRVEPDFLRNVMPPLVCQKLGEQKLGLVTCLYRGDPAADFWSLLEALGMSVEMPSGVVVADMLEGIRFALGPAVAFRRDALEAIGGIAATADYYSDDYVLGNKIWAAGYRVIFSHHFVYHVLTPRPFLRTLGDQLRWMKSTHDCISQPHDSVGCSGMGTAAGPARIAALLALSPARFPGIRGLGGQLLQSRFLLAWRDLSLYCWREDYRPGPRGSGPCPALTRASTWNLQPAFNRCA